VTTIRIPIGDATLTRVPYADVVVEPDVLQLTTDAIRSVPWAEPRWAEAGRPRVAAAAWVIASHGRTIVVDPAQAADDILRGADAVAHQEAFAAALEQDGFARDSVDTVVASHLDGIGMIAWRDGDDWTPFFPKARVLFHRAELAAIDAGEHRAQGIDALAALRATGCVDAVDDRHEVTPDVTLSWTGAHSPGHQIAAVESGGARAVLLGHLALSPLHCVVGDSELLHGDTAAALACLRELRDSRDLLIGPLWPTPGAARWDGMVMNAAETTARG
jgi:hypothetical protein